MCHVFVMIVDVLGGVPFVSDRILAMHCCANSVHQQEVGVQVGFSSCFRLAACSRGRSCGAAILPGVMLVRGKWKGHT